MEALPQDFYMTKYINDIPNRRNNISERRNNNNNNTKYNIFHSYIYLTLPLNKEGILQQHHQQQKLYHWLVNLYVVGSFETTTSCVWNININI